MKRLIKILPLVLIVIAISALTGCNNNVNAPGKAWAKTETLEYTVKDGDKTVGTMVTVTARLTAGEYALSTKPDRKFKFSANDATRVTTTVTSAEGKQLMYSESLMNRFSPVSSYKKTDLNGVVTETHSYFDGATARYSKNGAEYQKVKMKGNYTTNELLYTVLRCYNLTSYSASYQLISPELDGKIGVTVGSGAVADKFTFQTVNSDGEKESKDVGAYQVRISLSEKPVGSSILLWYTNADYKVMGSAAEGGLVSKQVPVKIVENNLTYILTKITVK